MNKQQYLAKRNALLGEAKQLIDSGNIEAFEAKKKEVEELDAQYEAAATARANLEALQGNGVVTDITNLGVIPAAGGIVAESIGNAMQGGDDPYATMEYRVAFMNNVIKGEEIPQRFRNANENTKTGDVGSVIPTPVMEKIIEKLEATGMILSRLTRTSIKGGLQVPTSSVKPVATWVAEGKGSDRQKKTTDRIVFNYHKLRCAVSVSLEVDTMALPVFEATLIKNVVEAMTKAVEQAAISGDGVGKPKGIIIEAPNAGQEIEAAGTIKDIEDAEANLPIEYESEAVWCMTKKTFMHYATLKDSNGQPIGRTNYGGVTNRPERVLMGRQVVLCNYLNSFAAADSGDVFAFLFNFSDYILNTNYEMTLKKYEDNETDDQVTKAVMIVDGKVVDKGSLVTLKKA